jgi:ATP-binding cassette subfamily B protein
VSDAATPTSERGWVRRLWPFLAAHKRKVLIAFGVSIGATLVTAVIPLIERSIVDNVIVAKTDPMVPLLTLLVAVGAAGFVFGYVRRFVGGRYALDVQHDLRTSIFERLQRLDFARHDDLPTGQLVSRASSDLALVQVMLSFLPIVTGNVILFVVSIVFMLAMSPLLTLVALVCVPALLIVTLKLRRVMFPAQWDSLQHQGEVAGVVDEAVTGVRVVKGFGQEQRELTHLTDAAEDLYRSQVRMVRIQAKWSSLLQAIPTFGQVAVLALGGWLALEGHITIGTFLAFSSYLVQLTAPVRMFAGMVAIAQQARAGAERIFEILDSNPIVTEKPDAVPLTVTSGEVELDAVTYGYLRSEPVLHDFTLRVAPGETVALVGASGSGKSTVSLLLPRFYDIQDGAIRIDGVDIRDVTLDSLRREVGVVFEDAFLFSDTVRANIGYGRPDASEEEITRAAEVAGAHSFILSLPDGYDTQVGERGLTLSGGQRQRISIARAVLTDPRILVLDDATSSVDARTEAQIHDTLREIMLNRTTVLIAHRRSTLRLASRIVLVDDGAVVDQGTHEELMVRSAKYRMLLAGPGETVEGDEADADVGEGGEPAVVGSPLVGEITPELWQRDDDTQTAAYSAFAPPPRAGGGGWGGMAASGGMAAPAGVGAVGPAMRSQMALAPTPELLERVAALPPADDDPKVDVEAESTEPATGFRLRRFLRPYRNPLVIGFLLVALDAALTLAGPFLVTQGINHGVVDHSSQALWLASITYLVVTVVDWIDTWIYTRYTGRTAERLLFALRIRIFSHLQRLALDYYDREMAGRVMTRMTTDIDAFQNLLQTGLINALVNVISLFGVVVILLVMSPPLMLAVLLILPPLLGATWWFRRTSSVAYMRSRDAIATVNAEFQENISGVRVAQAYVREDKNIESFQATAGDYLQARVRTQRIQAVYFPLILFLATCADAIVLGVGAPLVHNGTIQVGIVLGFIIYLDQFFAPIQQLSQVFDQWQQAAASLEKIDELMGTPVATPLPEQPVAPDALTGEIRFADVHFSYPGVGQEVLKGIDLEIPAGETVALVGETGAGKSTIVKLVARFYDVTGGAVLLDGTPVTELDLGAYRRRLGYVPQEPFLFSGTIRDNIAYGRPDASDFEVERAARAVGAHDFVAQLPGGYLHPVTERGRSMSAGERQLICLARALLVDPVILILDEATANLDLATESRVQHAMGLVSHGRTTLLIAHRLQTARAADRIVVVHDGRIVEQGTHDELVALAGRYSEFWESFAVEATAV